MLRSTEKISRHMQYCVWY